MIEDRALVRGDSFIFDAPDEVPALWGTETEVVASSGEPVLVTGPIGIGKTTLAQRLALNRTGIRMDKLLSYPVAMDDRPVLYVAADRPKQARRSLRRMVTEDDRAVLRDRLIVWRGILPFDIGRDPEELAALATGLEVGMVVLDSLKDCAVDLTKDETGSRINRCFQAVVAEGVELVALHHQRKASGDNRKPKSIDDVYGSTWIPAGCGTVLLLWGTPGDPMVELSHLKAPMGEVDPIEVLIDHVAGQLESADRPDPLEVLRELGETTVLGMARHVYGPNPSPRDKERTRRHLERLVGAGLATKFGGDKDTKAPDLYRSGRRLV
jgi:replicative DNA helicase